MGKAEARVEDYLVARVRAAGGCCYKFSASVTNGVPDRVVVLGRTVFVETKARDGRPSKLQLVRHEEIRSSGGEVNLAFTREQVDELVDALIDDMERARGAQEGGD